MLKLQENRKRLLIGKASLYNQHMSQQQEAYQEQSPLSWLFVPFTTAKAVYLLIFIGFFVFVNSMFNAFVADDLTYILRNPDIHQLHLLKLFGPNALPPENITVHFRLFSLLLSIPFPQQIRFSIISFKLFFILPRHCCFSSS